jgi:hypothetical protein
MMGGAPDPNEDFPRIMCQSAPERAEETLALLRQHQVHFYADQKGASIRFEVLPSAGLITVGTLGVGRLWAHAYGAFTLYDAVSCKHASGLGLLRLDSTSALRSGKALMKWAIDADLALARDPTAADKHEWIKRIPDGLPLPFDDRPFASPEHVADDLALLATGFIFFHELAHLELAHRECKGEASHGQEHEADAWAARWMLESTVIEPLARTKRLLGVAIGLGWLASNEIYQGVERSESHPPSHERLQRILSSHVPEPNHVVWAFTLVFIDLHLQTRGILPKPSQSFSTFRAAALDRIGRVEALAPI